MEKQTLKADPRKVLGRKVKGLRKSNLLPANIYGKKIKSESIQVSKDDFIKLYKKVGETGLVELLIGSDKKPVLVHNLQLHPVTDEPIHIDFLQVDLKEKVTATIPVELVGESPTEKSGVGTAVQQLNEIEVEALPGDLFEKFTADISNLVEVDQAIYVKDLDYDKEKVSVKIGLDQIVVKIEPPQKEEVVAPAPTVPTEETAVTPEEPQGETPLPQEESGQPKEEEKN